MKLPLSILKSFLETEATPAKIADTLTTLGIEVDGIEAELPPFHGVVVAEVRSCMKHASADKLQIAEVFDGKELFQVVCGASNCRPGLRTAYAKMGATLRDKAGAFHTIAPTKIRGVESMGMLCSAKELGMYEDDTGILELPAAFPLGADCLPLLWDPVFEISFTPNLGHCMSALGIARELAAAWKQPLKLHFPTSSFSGTPQISVHIENPTLCPRYMGQIIENVKVGPSPFWLRRELQAAGHNPVNNVVDVTNYILLKYGQPMHAFDYDKIEGKTVHLGPIKREEPFDTLTGKTVALHPGMLIISDAKKPIAIAGVMGGMNSSVSESTSTILLECASFDPLAVRSAMKKTDLRTEGAQRFEKGTDAQGLGMVLEIATRLIAEIADGTITTHPIDCKPTIFPPKVIRCRPNRVNQILGTKISHSEIREIFQRLGFKISLESEDVFQVEIPTYRLDITAEIDLVEEVARVYGYNNIERPLPKSSSPQLPHDPAYLFEKELRQRLIALGLQEFLTCDLISPRLSRIAAELTLAKEPFLQTLHSKSEDYSILRPSLLPGLLQVIASNLDHKNNTFSAFEIGKIHTQENKKPVEFPMAAIVLTGDDAPAHWEQKGQLSDFFTLKGLVENLLQGLRVSARFISSDHPTFHPGRQADLFAENEHIGTLGELHPKLLQLADIKQRVYYAEIHAGYLQKLQGPSPKCKPLAQFPASERDWTLPIDPKKPIAPIFEAIRSVHSPILERFELITLYRAGEKSNITIRFTYRDKSKTVSFEEVESAHAHLQQEVLAKTGLPG